MNPKLRVRVLRAALAALAVVAATLLAGCSYSLESVTQKPGPLDSVVVAPPSVA
jgi:hypothetical protein